MTRPPLLNRVVLAAMLLQLLGYAALSAIVPHSAFTAVLGPLQAVPTVVLVPFALLAVPAVVLAVAVGAVLAAIGFRPSLVVVLIAMYVVSVAGAWLYPLVRSPTASRWN